MVGVRPGRVIEPARYMIVDGIGGNRQRRKNAGDGHRGQQPEHHDRSEEIGRYAGERRGNRIAGMIEGFVAPDASGKCLRSDDAERYRRDSRRKDRSRCARDGLRRRYPFESGNERQREACQRNHDRGRDHQAALRCAAVDQRAGGGLGNDTGQCGDRHDHADAGLVPFLFGQQIDREIGAEAVAHVGEKEIQRVQRPFDLCGFQPCQTVLALAMVPGSQLCSSELSSARTCENLSTRRPREGGDPYHRRMFGEGWGRCECNNNHRRLWVPAFAGTTMSYPPTPFSLKYFSAPGWNGTGERACTWLSSEKLSASLCTATMSAFFSTSVLTMA